MSSSKDVADLIPKVKVMYQGRVPNVVVNCAGITLSGPTIDFKEDDYDRMVNTNMKVSKFAFIFFSLSEENIALK